MTVCGECTQGLLGDELRVVDPICGIIGSLSNYKFAKDGEQNTALRFLDPPQGNVEVMSTLRAAGPKPICLIGDLFLGFPRHHCSPRRPPLHMQWSALLPWRSPPLARSHRQRLMRLMCWLRPRQVSQVLTPFAGTVQTSRNCTRHVGLRVSKA